ncbi:HEAT repeat domain-containing protein [Paenibacillus sp. YN15]|uniref:HEAT repeat domain-containing protein n=1 Tax=Paenibacillus sp. YN15 TaxID=1742774 RepID=UPI000DCC4766|nr:HEAT repeat domain-containing protein [Paenibacillus sp. YN15]RAV01974.1 HEAT repeat domain-containing protein [Paenibacillus sp. YN15]
MSNALLIELKQETDRLYIAGSELAAGDFRLKRLLPRFEALAAQAPVFGKLAELIRQLAEEQPGGGQGPGSAWRLQELGLLLGSILATQSGAQPLEETAPLPAAAGLKLDSKLTCRQLAPIEQALTESGGGRYEIVTEAFQQGHFSDIRLFPLAINALGDPYPELADYVEKHIIPLYGAEAIPYLADGFDPQGGKREARKLQLLARLGGRPELILAAAEEGSDEVRAAAVRALGSLPGQTALLISYTRDRKKSIREAAYLALAEAGGQEGAETLYGAFSGKDSELAAQALSRHPWPELNRRLIPLLRVDVEKAIASNWSAEDKERAAAWGRIENYLAALGDSREPELEEVFAQVVRSSKAFQIPVWERLLERAAEYLVHSRTAETLELLFGLEERYPAGLRFAFRAAAELLAPKELFDRYGDTWTDKLKEAVGRKKSAPRTAQIIRVMESLVSHREQHTYRTLLADGSLREYTRMEMSASPDIAAAWDSRWLDWAIRHDAPELVAAFARPGHKSCRDYLTGKLLAKPDRHSRGDATVLLQGLERANEDPEVFRELLMQLLEQKNMQTYYSLDGYIFEQLLKLPPSYAERLAKLRPAYRYESAKQIEYVLEEMAK